MQLDKKSRKYRGLPYLSRANGLCAWGLLVLCGLFSCARNILIEDGGNFPAIFSRPDYRLYVSPDFYTYVDPDIQIDAPRKQATLKVAVYRARRCFFYRSSDPKKTKRKSPGLPPEAAVFRIEKCFHEPLRRQAVRLLIPNGQPPSPEMTDQQGIVVFAIPFPFLQNAEIGATKIVVVGRLTQTISWLDPLIFKLNVALHAREKWYSPPVFQSSTFANDWFVNSETRLVYLEKGKKIEYLVDNYSPYVAMRGKTGETITYVISETGIYNESGGYYLIKTPLRPGTTWYGKIGKCLQQFSIGGIDQIIQIGLAIYSGLVRVDATPLRITPACPNREQMFFKRGMGVVAIQTQALLKPHAPLVDRLQVVGFNVQPLSVE